MEEILKLLTKEQSEISQASIVDALANLISNTVASKNSEVMVRISEHGVIDLCVCGNHFYVTVLKSYPEVYSDQ